MALTWTGRSRASATNESRLAYDDDGIEVSVSAAAKVTDQFGWPTAWMAAEAMYARGEYVEYGTGFLVRVQSAACQLVIDGGEG